MANQSMHGSPYETNTPTWERCWLQSSSIHPDDEVREAPCYKTLGAKTQQLLQEKDEQSLWIKLHHLRQPKNNPYICLGLWEKKPYINSLDMHENRDGNLNFLIFDRYSFYRELSRITY